MSYEGLETKKDVSDAKQPFTPEFKAFFEKALGIYIPNEAFLLNLFESLDNSNIARRNRLANSTFGTGEQDVRLAQASLSLAGYNLGEYGVNGVDGKPGDLTLQAVRDFQRTVGLVPTGSLDQTTMNALDFITKKGFTKSDIETIGKEARKTLTPGKNDGKKEEIKKE